MKSIIVITPRFPFPVVGGDRLRIYHICKELSTRYDLHLYSLCDSASELIFECEEQSEIFSTITRFHQPKYISFFNCFLALFTKTPLQVAYYKNQKLLDCLKAIDFEVDAVLGHLIRVFPYIEIFNCKKFLELTDAISLNYSRIKKKGRNHSLIRSLIFSFEATRIAPYEDYAIEQSDASFVVSSIDFHFLADRSPKFSNKLYLSSNGVNCLKFPNIYNVTSLDIIFIGNMYSVQNLDAALSFCEIIFPMILPYCPNCKFKVVGRIRESDLLKFQHFKNVEIIGEVEDIATSIVEAAVGVCPMRIGAGVQNKILEYLSLGLPTVTSKLGYEGLDFIDEKDLLVANTDFDFASKVIKILSSPELSKRLSTSGRRAVEERYSWHQKLKPLLLEVQSHLNG